MGDRLEYERITQKSKGAVFAIMKYRRLLRSQGLGNVSFITLNTAYVNKNYIRLHSLLQELFLEVIDKSRFDYTLDKLNKVENGLEKLHTRHQDDRNLRILSIVNTL